MFIFPHATLKDLHEILAIEQASFSRPWHEESLACLLSDPLSITIIAKSSCNFLACGYSSCKVILPEAELLRVAVKPEGRRRGAGRALLDETFRIMRSQQVATLHLEVSEINQAAIALYKKSGFSLNGRRPGYYEHGTTAALIMQRNL